jgi:hypothetical protein
MKAGDLIQVRQQAHFADRPVADPPIEPGTLDFWVYAELLELTEAGARVRVSHQGNGQHGQELHVAAADLRDKAAVLALHDAVEHPNPQYAAQLKKHYQAQADRLS